MTGTTPIGRAEGKGRDQSRALWLSTIAFTVCFAVWTIFAIIGVRIKAELGLNETQFGLLVGTPILMGSLVRVLLGVWSDIYGGRIIYVAVMLSAAVATWLLSFAGSYPGFLLAGLGIGIAGGSFGVGVAYVSKWFSSERQGRALDIFGAGNIGAAITMVLAPFIMVAYGWQAVARVWGLALVVMAVVFWLLTPDEPELRARRQAGGKPPSFAAMLAPLRRLQVWRFSVYYFFVFGAFVALSLWLPRYAIGAYGLDIKTAGVIAAFFAVPASIFHIYGDRLSDSYGARRVMYWSFSVSVVCCLILSYPPTEYIVQSMRGPITFRFEVGLFAFSVLIFILGFFMSLGKAAVYKHIPVYYPQNVSAVGGVVGMVGGLGGFVLPIAFGLLTDLTGIWTIVFMLLFAISLLALIWMHVSIRAMEREALAPELKTLPELPEMREVHEPRHIGVLGPHLLKDWRPENEEFWETTGRRIAQRNLWLSIPALLLSFAVWMIWSVIVAKLPAAGFPFSTNQLFWLAALPGLSGATLRIFYSFMVPVFGGRLWTTLTTWSLMIPAVGVGLAMQNPDTPYWILLLLSLLCGLGGGNFASSMANISFFFPRAEKGNAMALNAGLGNLGVSVVQFVVPLVITISVFGWLGGEPQLIQRDGQTTPLWLQNAGFIWVPFIALSAFASWFGMNDLESAQASFADQSVIFQRRHNWIMCWLYTGTFGSFIGFSAGFPLLAQSQFPGIDALQFAFLGPLVGALSRSATGWVADRYGGGRVTFWVFIAMIAGVLGVLYALSAGSFAAFLGFFLFLFFITGVGNASTFQMIPVIMRLDMNRLMPDASVEIRTREAEKESAAIIGFTSAIAAFGAFFIPSAYGASIAWSGGAQAALWGFLVFYLSCIAITWVVYIRPGGLLFAAERRLRSAQA